MNEVEKMYENAGIEKLLYCDICKAQEHALGLCAETKCEPFYPPFTAEKQLELIKWLAKRQDFGLEYYPNSKVWDVQTQFSWEFYCKTYKHKEFEQAIAGLINKLWKKLSEEERKQIKEILEC